MITYPHWDLSWSMFVKRPHRKGIGGNNECPGRSLVQLLTTTSVYELYLSLRHVDVCYFSPLLKYINTYSHCTLYPHAKMTQVVESLPYDRQDLPYMASSCYFCLWRGAAKSQCTGSHDIHINCQDQNSGTPGIRSLYICCYIWY